MSARDVAAVDRLNSLRRPQKSGDKKNSVKNERPLSSEKRSPFHTSLPTSPIKDGRSDGDNLRRAMARHQVRQNTNNRHKQIKNKYCRLVCPALPPHSLARMMTCHQHPTDTLPTAGWHPWAAQCWIEGQVPATAWEEMGTGQWQQLEQPALQ